MLATVNSISGYILMLPLVKMKTFLCRSWFSNRAYENASCFSNVCRAANVFDPFRIIVLNISKKQS